MTAGTPAKYQLNIVLRDLNKNLASSKAVIDCERILAAKGYHSILFGFDRRPGRKLLSLIRLTVQLTRWATSVGKTSLIIVQYPLIGVNRFFNSFIKYFQAKDCTVVCLIHDIDSLRWEGSDESVKKEVQWLNAYNMLISHNAAMTRWMRSKGVTVEIKDLLLFDYLPGMPATVGSANAGTYVDLHQDRAAGFAADKYKILYAGNLNRGKFIYHLSEIPEVSFLLYGPNNSSGKLTSRPNVQWKGIFSPDEITAKLDGTFGLVWDGDSVQRCEGLLGDYIRYNNPHKLSMYLAAGLPVIVPANAAVCRFVEVHNLGFGISDLRMLPERLSRVSVAEYKSMISSISVMQQSITEGRYLGSLIEEIETGTVVTGQLTFQT